MTRHDYTYYRHTADGADTFYRIHLEQDTDAESPRDSCDNVSTLVTWDSRYLSPDRDRHGAADDIGARHLLDGALNSARKLYLYVKLYRPDILAAVPLVRGYDGTLSADADGAHNNHDGVAYVAAADWKMCMGNSPVEGGPWHLTATGEPDPDNAGGNRTPSALEAIEQDLETYNRWASGEYVGYVVEQAKRYTGSDDDDVLYVWGDPTDDLGSCWGFDDEEYAMTEAVTTLPDGVVKLDRTEVAALELASA